MHQVLESLESKKRRKTLSPNPSCPSPSLMKPLPHPNLALQSPRLIENNPDYFGALENLHKNNNNNNNNNVKELGACCNSPSADVEAKISGSNVVLKVISRREPGQMARIISVLERQSFEVLHLNVSSMEDTVLYSFLIKVYIHIYRYMVKKSPLNFLQSCIRYMVFAFLC